jgi:hypothetical protein
MLELSENFAQIRRPNWQRRLFGSHRLNALPVVAEQFSRPHGFLAGVGLTAMPTVLLAFDFLIFRLILSPTIYRNATALEIYALLTINYIHWKQQPQEKLNGPTKGSCRPREETRGPPRERSSRRPGTLLHRKGYPAITGPAWSARWRSALRRSASRKARSIDCSALSLGSQNVW